MSEKEKTSSEIPDFPTHTYLRNHFFALWLSEFSEDTLQKLEKKLWVLDAKFQKPDFLTHFEEDMEDYEIFEKVLAYQSEIKQLEYDNELWRYLYFDTYDPEKITWYATLIDMIVVWYCRHRITELRSAKVLSQIADKTKTIV